MCETYESFVSSERLVASRLHELHQSKLSFVELIESLIELIRPKLSNFLLMYPGSVPSSQMCDAPRRPRLTRHSA